MQQVFKLDAQSHPLVTRTLCKICKHWHKHALRNAPRALLRSIVNWFTEFCNSQWLLHFAAPFINMWTKTSVAESIHAHCSKLNTLWVYNVNHWCTTFVHWTHNSRLSTGLAPVHQPTITVVVWAHDCNHITGRFGKNSFLPTSPENTWCDWKMDVDTGWCSVDRSTTATFITYTTWVKLSRLPMPHHTQAFMLCVVPCSFGNIRNTCKQTA